MTLQMIEPGTVVDINEQDYRYGVGVRVAALGGQQ